MWLIVAHVPVPSSSSTLTSATFENRGTTTDRLLTRSDAPTAAPQDDQSDQPAEPQRAGDQMKPVEDHRDPARGGLRRVPGAAGQQQHRCRPQQRAGERHDLGDRPSLAVGPIEPQSGPGGEAEQREADHHVDVAASERGRAEQRHERPEIER